MSSEDVKLNLGLTSSIVVEKAVWIVEEAEKQGLDGVIVGEDLGRRQDVFTLSAIFLMKTNRIKVGIGITSPLYHNVTTIARASSTLNSIGLNRFILGIGVGGLQDLARAGIRVEKPVEALKEAVTIFRDIWSGRKITRSTRHYQLDNYAYRGGDSIPIIFGVRGPELLRLAGKVADGALISGSKSYLSRAVKTLNESLQTHGRDIKDFRIIAWMPTTLMVEGKGLEAAKKMVATILGDTPEQALSEIRLDLESIRNVKRMVSLGKEDKALDLIDERMMDEFCIYGDAREVASKLRGLRALGVDEVVFGPPYGRPFKTAIKNLVEEWNAL